MRKFLYALLPVLTFTCFLFLVSCDSNNNGGGATTTRVGPAGGTVESRDGRFRIVIPPGALTQDTDIVISKLSSEDIPPEIASADPVCVYIVEPEGLEFSLPVTVSLDLEDGAVQAGGSIGSDLFLLVADSGGVVEGLDNPIVTVNADTDTVTVTGEIDHFSEFAGIPLPPGFMINVDCGHTGGFNIGPGIMFDTFVDITSNVSVDAEVSINADPFGDAVSDIPVTIDDPQGATTQRASIERSCPSEPFMIDSVQNDTILTTTLTGLGAFTQTLFDYPAFQLGNTAILVACTTDNLVCTTLNTCSMNGCDPDTVFLPVSDGTDIVLTTSQDTLDFGGICGSENPAQTQSAMLCLEDPNGVPIQATAIDYTIGGTPGEVSVTGTGTDEGVDLMGSVFTGGDGCATIQIGINCTPGLDPIPITFTSEDASPVVITITGPGDDGGGQGLCDQIGGTYDTESMVIEDPFNEQNFVNDPCPFNVQLNADGTVMLTSAAGIDQTGTTQELPNGNCMVDASGIGNQAGFASVGLGTQLEFIQGMIGNIIYEGAATFEGNPFPAVGFGCTGEKQE